MASLPTGTVTLLFTDIEGSTQARPPARRRYGEVLESHRRVLRDAFASTAASRSTRRATRSSSPSAARTTPSRRRLRRSGGSQAARCAFAWASTPASRRLPTGGYYVGVDLSRAARICAAAHGGQVLLSRATRDLVGDDVEIRDLGEHLLKDIDAPSASTNWSCRASARLPRAARARPATCPHPHRLLRPPTRARRDPRPAGRRGTGRHADRAGRRRQDAPRPRGRAREQRRLPGRRLLRLARSGAGVGPRRPRWRRRSR